MQTHMRTTYRHDPLTPRCVTEEFPVDEPIGDNGFVMHQYVVCAFCGVEPVKVKVEMIGHHGVEDVLWEESTKKTTPPPKKKG